MSAYSKPDDVPIDQVREELNQIQPKYEHLVLVNALEKVQHSISILNHRFDEIDSKLLRLESDSTALQADVNIVKTDVKKLLCQDKRNPDIFFEVNAKNGEISARIVITLV
jgi:hypothetical protein